MCFRPANVSGGEVTCPHCGKTIKLMGGMMTKDCPFCKGDLTESLGSADEVPRSAASQGALKMPQTPKVPGGPQAPKMPKAPKKPLAPKKPATNPPDSQS